MENEVNRMNSQILVKEYDTDTNIYNFDEMNKCTLNQRHPFILQAVTS